MNSTLREMQEQYRAYDQTGREVTLVAGINLASCQKMQDLAAEIKARQLLEIGMAMGCSALALLEALPEDGRLISVDPYQTATHGYGYRGTGVEMVRRAGLAAKHELIEEPSFTALPRLVAQDAKFDLIFIDGWHTFDFAFIDFFYSDLLLREGGMLIFDDWGFPCVYHVIKFLEQHKAYKKIGPTTWNELNLLSKFNRFRSKVRKERAEWGSICAFQKIQESRVAPYFCSSTFYPSYRLHSVWAWLRRHEKVFPWTPPVDVGPDDALHSWESARLAESDSGAK